MNDTNVFPTYSHFLWFRVNNKSMPKLKQSKQVKLLIENGTNLMKEIDLVENLKQCNDVCVLEIILFKSNYI